MTLLYGYTSLTTHAEHRLAERVNITEEALGKLLDTKSYMSLGFESTFDREHCLFYSQLDDECFVAVQDKKTGEVITILPVDYHENLSWRLNEKFYYEMDAELLRRAEVLARYDVDPNSMTLKMSLKIRFLDSYGKIKEKTIKKIPAGQYQYNPNLLIGNAQKIANLMRRWGRDKNIHEVLELYVSLGRESKLYFASDEIVDEVQALAA